MIDRLTDEIWKIVLLVALWATCLTGLIFWTNVGGTPQPSGRMEVCDYSFSGRVYC